MHRYLLQHFNILVFTLVVLTFLVVPKPAHATIYPVGCASDLSARAASLIDAIHAANSDPDLTEINLDSDCVYTLAIVDNTTANSTNNGLPQITTAVTIHGNGAIIERSLSEQTPDFRMFDVVNGATLKLDNLTLRNGRVSPAVFSQPIGEIFQGGAIQVDASSLELLNVTIENNTVVGPSSFIEDTSLSVAGGGIGLTGHSKARISASTIANNTVIGSNSQLTNIDFFVVGGGISAIRTELVIINSTISQNTARIGPSIGKYGGAVGGGIFAEVASTFLSGTTIVQNMVDSVLPQQNNSGGFGTANGATFIVRNSIIAGNKASSHPDCGVSAQTGGYNVFGSKTECHGSNVLDFEVTDISTLLGPLTDNGGPTKTHALLPGTIAVNTITQYLPESTLTAYERTHDQRGMLRDSVPDIGAFEIVESDMPTATPTATATATPTAIPSPTATIEPGQSPSPRVFVPIVLSR